MPTFIDNLLGVAAPMAAAGVVSMAMVQTLKSATNLRQTFNTRVFCGWLLGGALGRHWMNALFRDGPYMTADDEALLLQHVEAMKSSKRVRTWLRDEGNYEQFFAQDIATIVDRLKAAGEMSLDYASTPQYSELFRTLSIRLGISDKDILPWLYMSTGGQAREEYREKLLEEGIVPEIEGEANMLRLSQSARGLFQSLLTQHLNGIRMRAETWWANINHVFAIMFGMLFLSWIQPLDLDPAKYSCFSAVTLSVIYCIFGGVMAPFAKDLVDNLTGAAATLKK